MNVKYCIVRGEDDQGVVIKAGLLEGVHDVCHRHVHVHHHGLVDVPGGVATHRDALHHLSPGLQRRLGRLEGEEREEGLVVAVGVQLPPVRHVHDDVLGPLAEDLGAVDPSVVLRHLLALPEVVEGGRVVSHRLVVTVVAEVVLAAQVETEERVETSPGRGVLGSAVPCEGNVFM